MKKTNKSNTKQPHKNENIKQKNVATSTPTLPLATALIVLLLAVTYFFLSPTPSSITPQPKAAAKRVVAAAPTVANFADPKSFGTTCDRRKASELSVEDYLRIYDAKKPVIIEGAMDGMGAERKWTKEWFIEHYGKERIVMNGVSDNNMDDQQQLAMPLSLFAEHAHEV